MLIPFPIFNIRNMSKASKLVADAILGEDTVTIIVMERLITFHHLQL